MLLTQVRASRQTPLMRNFSPDHKIHADSLIEIREGFDDVIKTLARGTIRWGTVRIKKVQVLNALILWFLRQSPETQRAIIGETMPMLRKHSESEERIEITSIPRTSEFGFGLNRPNRLGSPNGGSDDDISADDLPAPRRRR